jgi:hypothetical protein
MARSTRRLRKQAKAKAAKRPVKACFSSSATATLDAPQPFTPSTEDWSLEEPEQITTPQSDQYPTQHTKQPIGDRKPGDRRPGTVLTPEVPPVLRTESPPSHLPATRHETPPKPLGQPRVIPGRDLAPETRAGHRRQPFNDGWLWRDKILTGDLAVLVGDEASGKTRVLADWIARVTSGQPFPGLAPGQTLPPSDVLVFNSVDDFERNVLTQVAASGGDTDRVLHATTQLLEWGHSHSEFPPPGSAPPGPAEVEPADTRVRLHTQTALTQLRQFLARRPSIRLVVIDNLKQHVRTDSERVFEECVSDLLAISRQTEVAFIVTQRPDAFRNAQGLAHYFKSPSLTSLARAIWRVTPPDNPQHGERVLQCLKLNHGSRDSGREPWRIWQTPSGGLRWEQGTGDEFQLTRHEAKQHVLFHAKTFIGLYLQMFGGLADYQLLRFWARKEGISASKLFEASMVYNLGYCFEPCDTHELSLRKIIGSQEQIRKRLALDPAHRAPLIGPPEPKRRAKRPPKVTAADLDPGLDPGLAPVLATPGSTNAGFVSGGRVSPEHVSAISTISESGCGPSVRLTNGVTPASSEPGPGTTGRPRIDPLEALRARGERAQVRTAAVPGEGFRFIKPNLALAQILGAMVAELGSEEAMFERVRQGLESQTGLSPEELAGPLDEYRRFYAQSRESLEPETAPMTV